MVWSHFKHYRFNSAGRTSKYLLHEPVNTYTVYISPEKSHVHKGEGLKIKVTPRSTTTNPIEAICHSYWPIVTQVSILKSNFTWKNRQESAVLYGHTSAEGRIQRRGGPSPADLLSFYRTFVYLFHGHNVNTNTNTKCKHKKHGKKLS